jgi:hypothetical protein
MFEANTDRRIREKRVESRVNQIMTQQESALDARRSKVKYARKSRVCVRACVRACVRWRIHRPCIVSRNILAILPFSP